MKPTVVAVVSCLFISFAFSCKKSFISQTGQSQPQSASAKNSPENNSTTVSAHAICDYVLDETALTSGGWTKVFEDDFTTDLSKWNIWTGGAYNNELEYYQAANLQVANGNLVITVKKETVTGATTPSDPTPKIFNYTSGRVECKANVSAKTSTPKVRMIGRSKLPAGYWM